MKGLNLRFTITGMYDVNLFDHVVDEVMGKAPWLNRKALEGAIVKSGNLGPPPEHFEETKQALDEVKGFFYQEFDLPPAMEQAYLSWVAAGKPEATRVHNNTSK